MSLCAQGGFVTISELAVMVTERENDVIYQCHGTNEALGQTQVDTITLKVMCESSSIVSVTGTSHCFYMISFTSLLYCRVFHCIVHCLYRGIAM